MKNATRIKRLRKLYEVLKAAPKRQWNMGIFKEERVDKKNDHVCKTAACALGWAASDPWFKKRGLKLLPDDEEERGKHIVRSYGVVYRDRHGDEWKDLAAGKFFDLTEYESHTLFNPMDRKDEKKKVLENLKSLIYRYEKGDETIGD